MRAFLGILIGLIAAIAVQAGLDWIASQIYPVAITDLWDRRQVSEAFASRPTGALLLSVLNYFLAGLVGGVVAKRIARRGFAAWIPAAVLALMALLIAFAYPMPAWTWFASFAAPLVGGMFARHLGGEPASAPQAETA